MDTAVRVYEFRSTLLQDVALDAETQAGRAVAPCPDPAPWVVSQLRT